MNAGNPNRLSRLSSHQTVAGYVQHRRQAQRLRPRAQRPNPPLPMVVEGQHTPLTMCSSTRVVRQQPMQQTDEEACHPAMMRLAMREHSIEDRSLQTEASSSATRLSAALPHKASTCSAASMHERGTAMDGKMDQI
jgi:hypothetical protein